MSATLVRLPARLAICAALCLCLPRAASPQRQLSWEALNVEAVLDGDGTLHVLETHTMLFSGDWNGGERVFNLRPRQQFTFDGIDRVDLTSGERIPLTESAGLGSVDDYTFTDSRTLRWRNGLPSDPPFQGTRRRYVLRYQLAQILRQQRDRYVLDHDFAFPDRAGAIDDVGDGGGRHGGRRLRAELERFQRRRQQRRIEQRRIVGRRRWMVIRSAAFRPDWSTAATSWSSARDTS